MMAKSNLLSGFLKKPLKKLFTSLPPGDLFLAVLISILARKQLQQVCVFVLTEKITSSVHTDVMATLLQKVLI